MLPHHQALLAGYTAGLLGWLGIARVRRDLWARRGPSPFAQPWREVGLALLACGAVVGLGQVYVLGYRLRVQGPLGPLAEAVNQVVIFAPIFLLLVMRRHGPDTAWLPADRVWQRLLVGVGLALFAILAYTLTRAESDAWPTVLARVWRPKNVSYAVQVFCEDVAVAVLLVRFRAAVGTRLSVLLVAGLFAAAHLPTLIAQGVPLGQTLSLLLDAGLGVRARVVLCRAQDMWWFWCLHTAMDLMQFDALPPAVSLAP
jgi:hypothetical protein